MFPEKVGAAQMRNARWDDSLGPQPVQGAIKRAIDLVITVPGLIFLLPVLGMIALAVKLSSKGPAFHIEERIGLRGRNFRCIKFRTMFLDSERLLQECLATNEEAAEEWETFCKLRGHDPRITRIGRTLRRFSLDEMPQMFNIIKGEMSIVGSRPFLPRELPRIGAASEVIFSMKPGMAGVWVASGRNGLSFAERVKLEEEYVHNWSLGLDVKVFLKCFKALVTGREAY